VHTKAGNEGRLSRLDETTACPKGRRRQQWQHGADLKLGWQRPLPLLGYEDDMIVDMDEMHANLNMKEMSKNGTMCSPLTFD
jgi:hypothetical protein